MKKERATTSDEQRERMLIAEQIERAEAEAGPSSSSSHSSSTPPVEEGLKRDEGTDKVVLSFSAKLPTTLPSAPTPILKLNPLKPNPAINPLKANPLKRSLPAQDSDMGEKRRPPITAAERLIVEDQERRRRRENVS